MNKQNTKNSPLLRSELYKDKILRLHFLCHPSRDFIDKVTKVTLIKSQKIKIIGVAKTES